MNREQIKIGLEYFLFRKLEEMPNPEKEKGGRLYDVFGFDNYLTKDKSRKESPQIL